MSSDFPDLSSKIRTPQQRACIRMKVRQKPEILFPMELGTDLKWTRPASLAFRLLDSDIYRRGMGKWADAREFSLQCGIAPVGIAHLTLSNQVSVQHHPRLRPRTHTRDCHFYNATVSEPKSLNKSNSEIPKRRPTAPPVQAYLVHTVPIISIGRLGQLGVSSSCY